MPGDGPLFDDLALEFSDGTEQGCNSRPEAVDVSNPSVWDTRQQAPTPDDRNTRRHFDLAAFDGITSCLPSITRPLATTSLVRFRLQLAP